MSWPWIVLLGLAVALVAAAEWRRVSHLTGADVRRSRQRQRQKAKLRVITAEKDTASDDFAKSVQRDLDALPTTEDPHTRKR